MSLNPLGGYFQGPTGERITYEFIDINASSSGDNMIVAARTDRKIRVWQYKRIAAAEVTATFKSSGGTVLDGPCALAARGGESEGFSPIGKFETVAGEALVLNLSGAVQVGGSLACSYMEG